MTEDRRYKELGAPSLENRYPVHFSTENYISIAAYSRSFREGNKERRYGVYRPNYRAHHWGYVTLPSILNFPFLDPFLIPLKLSHKVTTTNAHEQQTEASVSNSPPSSSVTANTSSSSAAAPSKKVTQPSSSSKKEGYLGKWNCFELMSAMMRVSTKLKRRYKRNTVGMSLPQHLLTPIISPFLTHHRQFHQSRRPNQQRGNHRRRTHFSPPLHTHDRRLPNQRHGSRPSRRSLCASAPEKQGYGQYAAHH
jgi:hypothetical protein